MSPSPRSRSARVDPPPLKGGGCADGLNSVPLPQGWERDSEAKLSRERGGKEVLRGRAKAMRSEPTPAEHRLWQILRAKRLAGFKFKRQLPVDRYIVDFACPARRLIIEADGGQHSESERDTQRDAYLRSQGFRILRFWNNDILNNLEGVAQLIAAALSTPHPAQASPESPSPSRGEGFSGAPHA